jgi:polygalacturonase
MPLSHITFQIDAGATLQGPPHATDYPPHVGIAGDPWSGKFDGVIGAERATDITITGKGRIDGNGADSWKNEHEQKAAAIAAGKPPRAGSGVTQRPRMVQFSECDHITVTGITLSNSHQFHLVFSGCENVVADGLTIFAPSTSPETDGVDLRGAKHVQIRNCHIDNGDDEVAVKGGYQPADRSTFVCEDIEISHCTFLSGHGMSIGSDTAGNVRNVYCHDCTFDGTSNGIRIKSMRDRGGTVENVRYENLTMTNVEEGIVINAYYRKPPKTDTAQPVTPLTPLFREIRIRNVIGTCTKSVGMIVGLPEVGVSDVVLEDVKLSGPTGMVVRNATGVVFKNVEITPAKGKPVAVQDADVKRE